MISIDHADADAFPCQRLAHPLGESSALFIDHVTNLHVNRFHTRERQQTFMQCPIIHASVWLTIIGDSIFAMRHLTSNCDVFTQFSTSSQYAHFRATFRVYTNSPDRFPNSRRLRRMHVLVIHRKSYGTHRHRIFL